MNFYTNPAVAIFSPFHRHAAGFLALTAVMSIAGCGGEIADLHSNLAPIVEAGANLTANEGDAVQISGLAVDPEGGALEILWSQVSGPTVALSSTTELEFTVHVPELPIRPNPVVLSMRATDDEGASTTDTLTIDVRSTDFLLFLAGNEYERGILQNQIHRYDPEANTRCLVSNDQSDDDRINMFFVSPDHRWVMYQLSHPITRIEETYVAATDCSGAIRIIPPPQIADVSNGRWSPDSSRIDYRSEDSIFLTDPNGENHEEIVLPNDEPAAMRQHLTLWSPDGRYLLQSASTNPRQREALYSYDTQTGINVRISIPVLPGGRVADDFAWAPDSSRIAYRSQQSRTDGSFELYTVRPDGSEHLKLNAPLEVRQHVTRFAWAPDSSRILYLSNEENRIFYEIHSILPNGTDRRKLNGRLIFSEDVVSFQWSPDSSRVVYQTRQANTFLVALHTVRFDGSEQRDLTNTIDWNRQHQFTYQWSPDSSRLLVRASTSQLGDAAVWELFAARPDSSETIKVNGPLPVGSEVAGGVWSPSGSHIFYRADQEQPDVDELYSVRPDGSENTKINAVLQSARQEVSGFQWSLDSSRIVYVVDDGTAVLYLATPDGLNHQTVSGDLDASAGQMSWHK